MSSTMKAYEPKASSVVQAMQFEPERHHLEKIKNGGTALFLDDYKIEEDGDGYFLDVDGARASRGDWLVRHADGRTEVVKASDFDNTYRPFSGPPPNYEQVRAGQLLDVPAENVSPDIELPPVQAMVGKEGEQAVRDAVSSPQPRASGAMTTGTLAGGGVTDFAVGENSGLQKEGEDESDALPDDLPSRALLEEQGYETCSQVREASDEELLAISGIGEVKLAEIRDALK